MDPVSGIGLALGVGGSIFSFANQMSAADALEGKAGYYAQMQAIYDQQAEQIKINAENEARYYRENAKFLQEQAGIYSQIGEFNRGAAKLDEISILMRATKLAIDLSRDTSKLMGEQVAKYAAGGVEVSSGTPLTVLSETNRLVEEDLANLFAERDLAVAKTRLAGEISGFQSEMQGLNLTHQATMQETAAYQAEQEGKWRAWEARYMGWQQMVSGQDARAQASATRWGAFGNLITAGGTAASKLYSPKKK